MKQYIIFCFTFSLALTVSGCSLFSRREQLYSGQPLYVGYEPNLDLVIGTYLNSFNPDQDTLVLTGGYGLLFFLITKDSTGKSIIIRGRWGQIYQSEHVMVNEPGHFQMSPQGDPRIWRSTIRIEEKSEDDVQIVIDTLQAWKRMTSKEMSKAWEEHWVDTLGGIRLNSRGLPYRFVKQLHRDR